VAQTFTSFAILAVSSPLLAFWLTESALLLRGQLRPLP